MTEAEWLASTDPGEMVAFLWRVRTDRKWRLFEVACCHRVWDALTSPESRAAVVAAELYADGRVTELHCTYDPATRGGDSPDGRRPKATLHWVSARHALPAEVRLYGTLFKEEQPDPNAPGGLGQALDPESLTVVDRAFVEPALADAGEGERFQFERQGYFCVDRDARPGRPVFNRTATLRDTWAKVSKQPGAAGD